MGVLCTMRLRCQSSCHQTIIPLLRVQLCVSANVDMQRCSKLEASIVCVVDVQAVQANYPAQIHMLSYF